MNKFAALIIVVICLLTLSCCRGRPQENSSERKSLTAEEMEEKLEMKVVRVLLDLPNAEIGIKDGQLMDALQGLPGYGKEFTLYVESMLGESPDRDNKMTRIKTEIMAGKGPDLFLCGQDTYGVSGMTYAGMDDPFFKFPEKAMKNRIFLPLDDYIEKAEYMEWDKFLPVVMEAGRNDEGQQIIPMAYFFPVTIVEKEKYGLEDFVYPKTRIEMAQSGNAAVRVASSLRTPDFVGRIMEPGADEPMFSEEELLEYMQEDYEMTRMVSRSDYDALLEDEAAHQGAFFRTKVGLELTMGEPIPMGLDSPEYSILPGRNHKGGVTASVAAFAAINRNARYPDIAFNIIDYIMRTRNQQKSSLFKERLMGGMPVHMDVGTKELPMDDGWYMNEVNFKEFCAARAEISEVKFPGPVDEAVWSIFASTIEELENSVHEQYVYMEMLLAES